MADDTTTTTTTTTTTHQWNIGIRLFGYPMPVFSLTALRMGGNTSLDLKLLVWKLGLSIALINYE